MKVKSFLAAAVLSLLSTTATLPSHAFNWTSEMSALYKGKFDVVVAKFSKDIDSSKPPKSYYPFQLRAYAYYGLKEYEKCITDLDSAIARVPASAYSTHTKGQLTFQKGLCYQSMGKPLEAEREFRLSLEQYPSIETDYVNFMPYQTNENARAYWSDFLDKIRSVKTKLATGEFKQQAEQQKTDALAKTSHEKLTAIAQIIEKNEFQSAFSAMMDYLKEDKQRLATIGAESLEQAAIGTPSATTAFNLVAAAIQTNISGDTLRAQSLGRAAATLLKNQPHTPMNNFCKTKLASALPEVTTLTASTQPQAVELDAGTEQRDPNRPITDKWAIIVGIGNFADKSIPALKYPTKDAKDFYDFLVNKANFAPDHIRLLLDEQATQRRILTELGDKFLPRVARKDDLVVLYLSSHGSPSKVDVKDKNYLVAYDTEKSNLFASGIEMQDLTQLIKSRVDSERVLIVLDACHSGAADASAKDAGPPSNFDAERIAQGCGQMVICSSEPAERSWESKRYANGIFTRKLIEGLQRNGSNTKLGEAFDFVKNEVHNEVQEDEGITQTPVLKSKWNGNELILTVTPSEPRTLPVTVKQMLSPDSLTSPAPLQSQQKNSAPAKVKR